MDFYGRVEIEFSEVIDEKDFDISFSV